MENLTFVHLSTEVDAGLGTHTHMHTHIHVHTCHVYRRYNISEQKHIDPTTAVIYLHCIFLCLYAVSVVMFSLFFPCGMLLLSSALLPRAVTPVAVYGASYWTAVAETRKRWTDRGGGGGAGGGWGFRRVKNRERKRSQKGRKLKILPLAAESHWSQCKVVTLLAAAVEVVVVVVMMVRWTQTWGKPRFSHRGWAAVFEHDCNFPFSKPIPLPPSRNS